ncbi:37934_t:CDS:1, partial [Gigaspora margarita]
MLDKWQEIYKPQGWINKCIYEELNRTVSEEEWSQTLTEVNLKSAPETSGIGYALIKGANSE